MDGRRWTLESERRFFKTAWAPVFLFPFFFLLACQSEEEVKTQQYFVEGLERYQQHCANCHQPDGQGLGSLYPPIAGADFLNDKAAVICAMRYGLNDTLRINGKTYHQPMPGNEQLRDLDLAELSTYIHQKWGNQKGRTTVEEVRRALATCR
jgi:mono/diheme cytochrome c family protein